ncbi:MAG: hypothetical protein JST80_13120 [Bdellovibrionales bacterium]|nr:hypothetical protein [Bdellovibrionales bacterium]
MISDQMAFYEITGDDQVEKIKKQILRLMVTQQDLGMTESVLKETLNLLNQGDQINQVIIQSMTVCAIISYTRCFNSSYSYPLSPDIYDSSISGPATANADETQVSEKQFHFLIMNYRNKHIAHSDDFLKSGIVGGAMIGDEYAVAPLIASRVPSENKNFYNSMGRLNSKALAHVGNKLKQTQDKLLELLKSGKATITAKEATLTPIPLEVDALKMWGLSES